MANHPKIIACATLVILFCPAGSKGQVGLNVYAGGGTLPVRTDGFADLHLSDWEKFGTGGAEGRVHLPFGDVNVDGQQPSFFIGVEGTELPALFEIQMASKDGLDYAQLLVGWRFHLREGSSYSLDFIPKLGAGVGLVEFGEVEILEGKTPPVVLDKGTVHVGDKIRAELFGGVLQAAVSANITLAGGVNILAQGGWNLAFLPDLDLRTDPKDSDFDEVKLNGDDEALVKPEIGSTEQAGVEPNVKSNGYVAMLSVGYRFLSAPRPW